MVGSVWRPNRVVRSVALCGRGLDKIIALEQKGAGGLEVELAIDRDKGQQGMEREGQDAAKQTPGDTNGEGPVLEVGNALCVRMSCKDRHFCLPFLALLVFRRCAVDCGKQLDADAVP